ncbi:MAG: CocE/NonD family hydrolase [Anaerolineae bacterium]|nr:CocE/NonD family hydrolase [Anaerolineae bacterium]
MRIKTEFPRVIREIENVFIALKDGTRLAARIWLPTDAEENPVPAILEYLPYRKNDRTAGRDHNRMPYFAGHGYAAVRVDMRGSGDSDGILLDEYLPQEQDDALEVIEWIALQSWCSGAVGMVGISWGGFNSLQIAARRPPALKAVVAIAFTVDRYNEDVHYLGGSVISEMLPWASTMLAYNARPPDPRFVGERWREMWMERMEKCPPYVEQWLTHQRRDAYWTHGSVCEDYAAIQCPVLAVAGAADAYNYSLFRLLEGLSVPRLGIYGPWAHIYPHHALPEPAIGFLQECLRWWDKWLKGAETGIMNEPMLRAWMQEYVPPKTFYAARPGRWVGEESYPSPRIVSREYRLSGQSLIPMPADESNSTAEQSGEINSAIPEREIVGVQSAGMTMGAWGIYGKAGTYADDQRVEDGKTMTFTSEPVRERFEILGMPRVTLEVSADQPNALVSVRLCDVAPDGASLLLSWGILNLTHRDSDEFPEPVEPNKKYTVRFELKPLAHVLAPGHRIRVGVSPTNFPHAWPSPVPVRLRVFFGASGISLPVRTPRPQDAQIAFQAPEGSAPLVVEWLREGQDSAVLEHDLVTQQVTLSRRSDGGCYRIVANGIEYADADLDQFSIVEGEPLSARTRCERMIQVKRADWDVRVETTSELNSDASNFYLLNVLKGYEGGEQVFTKTWEKAIPRDLG